MILKILINDDSPPYTITKPRKIIAMGYEYPDYESASTDFDMLCEVFGRLIDYRKILEDYQSLESSTKRNENE